MEDTRGALTHGCILLDLAFRRACRSSKELTFDGEASFQFVMFVSWPLTMHQLKEQLELNAATRSLILTVLATFYIPLAFVSSYFGMNASGFTDGGLVSTTTFWQIAVPLVVASIIIPVTFSGLLIRILAQFVYSLYQRLMGAIFWSLECIEAMMDLAALMSFWICGKLPRTDTGVIDTGTNAA